MSRYTSPERRTSTINTSSMVMPNTSVTTYGLPSEIHLGNGGTMSDEMARARRVQQQVQMRLAEKSTLPRQNGSAAHYAMSDYGGSSTMKYQTYNPNYSSKSFVYSGSRTMGPRISQRSGFSGHSAGPDLAQMHRISVGGGGGGGGGVVVGGGGGGGFYREDIRMGNYQGIARQPSRIDPETLSLHAVRQHTAQATPWMVDGSDAGSMISERDATLSRQYAQSVNNGYTSQVRQGGGTMTFTSPMRRSLSGTLSRGGGMAVGDAEVIQQPSFKGPAHRTINRITNRNRMSVGSMSGQQISSGGSTYGGGGDRVDRGFITSGVSSASQGNLMQRQGTMSRAMSVKSMQSVGRGMDIYSGQMEMGASMGNLSGITSLDMPTAVQNLREPDHELQVLGAAYIQHECYNDNDAKNEVRRLKGIGELVRLFNCDNQEVQRYATGATRNLIYENMDNKVALIEEGGIPQLVEALKDQDDELHKNITGILWNLSSKDNLKEKLARETLPELTDKILVPLSGGGESEAIQQTASEADIFYNTTGCLRNMSSVNEKTRQLMRETHGLVDSLVGYIKTSLDENKAEDKGVENAVCVLRNLSYQLYSEMPPSSMMRLEGPTRGQDSGKGDAIGCFTPQSRKAKNSKNQDLSTFTEVARVPKGVEWLWHPQIVGVYNRVLRQCEINSTTREAAAGALQNITAGDKRWASVLSRVALEQERMLPVLLDLLRTNNDLELRSLTGFLRNLSRHSRDKNDMATKVVNNLVNKLPDDGNKKEPSSEVVVNICGVLNNLVTSSTLAARDITFFDGLPKLIGIKNSHDNSSGKIKAAKAAATVLSNMFQYKKLHKNYKEKGFSRPDFADMSI
ncbi:plakophilin-3a isoform X1 [Etheostoma spectabile]|uniref:plakophilin-3a isoform X1 n=1 Tax=Etheostoma spectabile TaxID=54343 RepID=UPI0013AEE458|nr:plakophilin-3 isoform X1 [Etheostoma spectabile]